MSRYANGQPVRVSTTVRDVTGALVDAGALSLTVQKPDLTTQVYASPTRDSLGTYHQDLPATDLAQNGHYLYVWQSTGAGAGVSRGDFDVFDPFEPAVMSLQDAKETLNLKQTTTADDNEIQGMIDSIETDLEAITGGPLVNRSITERVQATRYQTALVVRKRPLVSITSVTDVSSGVALSITDFEVDTNAGIVRRKLQMPFLSWGPYYTVVYVAGWGTVMPAAFNQAARIIIKHMWETQRGPQQRRYGNAEPEEIVMIGMSYAIPNRALEKLRPFTLEAYI